jgi:hypothetical protein
MVKVAGKRNRQRNGWTKGTEGDRRRQSDRFDQSDRSPDSHPTGKCVDASAHRPIAHRLCTPSEKHKQQGARPNDTDGKRHRANQPNQTGPPGVT